jgi:hypothetical protein
MSLETIKERADAATPGPWHRLPAQEGTGFDDRMGAVLTNGDLTPVAYTAALGFQQRHSDAAFIAHARQDIPALLRVAEAAARDMENCAGCKADERGYCYRHNETGPTLRDLDALP